MDRTRVFLKRSLLAVGLLILPTLLFAQSGPYAAQIQAAIRALLAGNQTISGNWTCSGSCSGFGGSSIIHQATVTLTDAQIKALTDPGTLVEVVAAPGVANLIVPVTAYLSTDFVMGYTLPLNTGFLAVVYGEYDADAFTKVNGNSFVTTTGNSALLLPLMAPPRTGSEADVFWGLIQTQASLTNKPLKIYAESPSPFTWTGGNAANRLIVSVSYLVFNTASGQFE